MTNEEHVVNIDLQIEQAKEAIATRDALKRLETNPDFKKVFTEEFFKNFATQLVWQRGETTAQMNPQLLEAIDRNIACIGSMRSWLHTVNAQGAQAESAIVQADAAIAAMAAEELADE